MFRRVVNFHRMLQLCLLAVELFPPQRTGRDRLIFAECLEHTVGHCPTAGDENRGRQQGKG